MRFSVAFYAVALASAMTACGGGRGGDAPVPTQDGGLAHGGVPDDRYAMANACFTVHDRAAGTVLYDFGIGETNPEVPVPDIIKQTIASSTMNEENHYSPAQGDPKLLQAISE